ncbi:MAG: hypothetical protein KBC53_04035 [Nitrosomonas sp.]|nr:hypothetical protein [Nitrosomonas sp.]
MSAGAITFFNQFKVDLGNKIHDLDGDTFKLALVTSVVTPAASDAAPHFGGTGTTNYATNEVSAGGNYSAGGSALASVSFSDSGGTVSWKADKASIAYNASNPANARWGIIYNSTDANKRAVAILDLGAVLDLSKGPFEWRFNSVDGNGTIATL